MKSPGLLVFTAVALAAAVALADDPPAAQQPIATGRAAADIANFETMAKSAADANEINLAEVYYSRLLAIDAPDADKKQALFDMFDVYREHAAYSKAVAVGEKVHELFPLDPDTPELLLKLGQLYRQIGAYDMATARFYNVLNAALRIDPSQFTKYQQYSTQAQFEIAETFMTEGDYQQAARSYTMLDRLDLAPDQKAHAEFEAAYCTFLQGDYKAAAARSRQFLEAYTDTEYSPECHYVLAIALKALHQPQEASDEVMTLLRMETQLKDKDAGAWIFWKKKTGNQLANGFYQEGDYLRALTIYQEMAKLGDDPEWQWPVIYQVGLCFERLRLTDRATEAYQFIVDANKKAEAGGKAMSDDLLELGKMAEWRVQHLQWQETTELQLSALLGPKAPADDPTADGSQTAPSDDTKTKAAPDNANANPSPAAEAKASPPEGQNVTSTP